MESVKAQAREWPNTIVYEIFVRSFQDSNGDGHGDINGITGRLDYLRTLGVNAIWLTPIFPSPSYHGYDTTDYKAINPQFGSMSDFARLVSESHRRGIRVVLDLALNHTSSDHPWFKTRVSDLFVWRPQNPNWPGNVWHGLNGLFYYGFFGPTLPDLNWNNASIRNEMKSVLKFWIQQGVDGFRLDAVRYLIEGPQGQPDTRENHAVLADAVAEVRRAYPQILFIGEVWADSPVIGPYVNQRNEMDLCFNFPFSGGLLGSLINERASDFENALLSNQQFVSSQRFLSPFITNHDMTRVSSLFQQNVDKLKLAAYLMLTASGTPVLYYGEEIGMTNGPSVSPTGGIFTAKPKMNPRNDMSKRTPMQWTTAMNHGFTGDGAKPWNLFSSNSSELTVEMQMKQSGSLLMAYRELIQIRKTKLPAALDRGQFIQSRDSSVSILLRSAEGRLFLSVANFSRQARLVQFSFSKSAANSARRAASGPINYQALWGLTPFELHEQGNQIQVRIPSLAAFKALLIEIK